MRRTTPLCAICLALVAFGSGCGDIDESTPSALRILPSNADIMAAVYDRSYSVPDGFFVDERTHTATSYTMHHVRDPSGSYELCTDDYEQARKWEAADNDNRRASGYYVGSYENERYFEFIRELYYPDAIGAVQSLTSPGFARIFKCAMVNRDGVDTNLDDGYAGLLNFRPLTADVVAEFAEYLWQFTFFGTSQRKVLDSYTIERENTFEHALLLAFLWPRGHGQCDRIEVFEWVHIADKSSGDLMREYRFLFAIDAKQVNGVAMQCD
jgi:hypothetical protein